MVCCATLTSAVVPKAAPVFGLRSNCGKWLLVTCTRIRCPFRNATDVPTRSISNRYTWPGVRRLGLRQALAVARAHDSLRHVVARAVGMHVDQLGDEVRVHGIRGGVQHHLDRTGDLELFAAGRRTCRRGRRAGPRSGAGPAGRRPSACRSSCCRPPTGPGRRDRSGTDPSGDAPAGFVQRQTPVAAGRCWPCRRCVKYSGR